jgi:hypothetical protein
MVAEGGNARQTGRLSRIRATGRNSFAQIVGPY